MDETSKMVELTETELEMLCKAAWMQAKNLENAAECTVYEETRQLLNEERKSFISLWTKLGLNLGDS